MRERKFIRGNGTVIGEEEFILEVVNKAKKLGEKELCLSIKTLYETYGETLTYGTILVTGQKDCLYYDFCDEAGNIVCMDGESLQIKERDIGSVDKKEYIIFSNKNGMEEMEVKLSAEEFMSCTFI